MKIMSLNSSDSRHKQTFKADLSLAKKASSMVRKEITKTNGIRQELIDKNAFFETPETTNIKLLPNHKKLFKGLKRAFKSLTKEYNGVKFRIVQDKDSPIDSMRIQYTDKEGTNLILKDTAITADDLLPTEIEGKISYEKAVHRIIKGASLASLTENVSNSVKQTNPIKNMYKELFMNKPKANQK